MPQIKTSEIPKYRRMIAGKQDYRCGICKARLAGSVQTLDHCHTTGRLRGVLCSSCNMSEGKVKKGAQYLSKSTHLSRTDYLSWLRALISYLENYNDNRKGVIHPTFDLTTGKQKPVKRRKRA